MRSLLTKNLFRSATRPASNKTILHAVTLEDRSVPAAFTFAGLGFDTNDAPDKLNFLTAGTYNGAIVTAEPTSAIAVGVAFPDQPATFPATAATGTYFFGGTGARALNLPAGDNGTNARSGFEAEYQGGRAIANAGGAELVVYESSSTLADPEGFMVQAYNVNTGTWSPWYFSQASSKSLYVGDPAQGAFATQIDLSNLGFATGEYATKFRLVNLTSQDRLALGSSGGQGVVIPNDNGATSTLLPTPGPLGPPSYNSANLDPDPIFFGALGTAATNITNVRTTVTVTPASAGQPATYTVLIENLGSGNASGVNPVFTYDPNFTPTGITTSSTLGATGNTTNPNGDTLTLPAYSTVTYVITGNISPFATGPLQNTFNGGKAALPALDPNLNDNSVTTATPVTQSGAVTITISPSSGSAPSGAPITYTITVNNNGPAGFNGVGISDVIPPGLTGVTFTSTTIGGATGNTPAGNGTINDIGNLPPNSKIVYTVTGTIPPTFSGNIPFSASAKVAAPGINTDPNGGTATVNTNAVLTGDLFVTMTASPMNPISGTPVTYTIVASNKGPSTATASLLTDNFSSGFTGVSYTSVNSGGASGNKATGTGDLNEVLTLPTGGTVTYTVVATLSTSTTGLVTNTSLIAAPNGFTDPDPSNNSASVSVNAIPGADVGLTVTPNTPVASVGGPIKYTVEIFNNGPAPANGIKVGSLLDSNILGVTFTSTASNGGNGNTSAGNGNINDTVNIPVGGKITYIIGGTVRTGITGNLVSTFTGNSPVADPNPGDNTVTITTPTQPSPKVIYAASTGKGVSTQVFVFNADGTPRFSYAPYDPKFTRGVNVGIGDVNGDGFPDVVTGTSAGGGSHVRAVDGLDGKDLFSFFAYGSTVRTGVMVTVDDVDGDGLSEIITGSDTGGGPRIRIFDMKQQGQTGKSILDFFAFPENVRSGVRVTSGNFFGDSKAEIAVSTAKGGSSQVRIFNGATGAPISTFLPYGASTRGSYLAAADFNGTGFDQIVVGDDRGATPLVRVFDPQLNYKQQAEYVAYETNFKGGSRVATYNDDSISVANPPARILTGPGEGGGPRLRKFTGTGGDLGSQFLIGSFDRGGIFVG